MQNENDRGASSCWCWELSLDYAAHPGLHIHHFSEFFLCLDGKGFQYTEGGRQAMQPGELYYFPPQHLHIGSGGLDTPCRANVLYVPTHTFSPINEGDQETNRILRMLTARASTGQYRLPLSPVGTTRVTSMLQQMVEEFNAGAPGYTCAVHCLIRSMLLTILRDPASPPELLHAFAPQRQDRLREVLRYLHTHYMYPITVSTAADLAHLGRSQFHNVFKTETGKCFITYLTDLRLSVAISLLRETSVSIVDIAYRCGFSCISHFYQLFHDRYGVSPGSIRKA